MQVDKIGYNAIIENAMRGVVYAVLKKVEKQGLFGGHHFVIQFSTKTFGAIIPESLKKRFPSEMTIVIQHQFNSLIVTESYFKISLSFSGALETLTIPYLSIISFSDPSVDFGLKFNETENNEQDQIFAEPRDEANIDGSDKIISLEDFRKNHNKK